VSEWLSELHSVLVVAMGGIVARFKKDPPSADSDSNDLDNNSQTKSSPGKKRNTDKEDASIASASSQRGQENIKAVEKLKKTTKNLVNINRLTANKSTAKGREANRKFQRKMYLKVRAAKLRGRLKDRPTDQRALQEYGSILYEQENYMTAPKVIKRILATGDTSGDWYLKLGKCYFRRWARLRNLVGMLLLNHSVVLYCSCFVPLHVFATKYMLIGMLFLLFTQNCMMLWIATRLLCKTL
jgi:hypothetical protein